MTTFQLQSSGFADIHDGGELVEVVGREQLGHLGAEELR